MNCTIFLYHSLSPYVLEFTVTSFTPYFVLRDSGNVERFSAGIGSSVRCNSKRVKALFHGLAGYWKEGGGRTRIKEGRRRQLPPKILTFLHYVTSETRSDPVTLQLCSILFTNCRYSNKKQLISPLYFRKAVVTNS